VPSTGPYPEPDQSSPYHPILSLLRSILTLFTHLRLGLPSGLFPSGFPTMYVGLIVKVRLLEKELCICCGGAAVVLTKRPVERKMQNTE
jgi:hypothetical protein